jgi:phage baseplate assembly protein W
MGWLLMDISLLKVDETTRKVTLQLGSKTVTGLTKLTQIVVLSLLNSPGRDILDPDRGSGIPDMVGMNYDPLDLSEVVSDLTSKIRKSETEIRLDQVGLNSPASERLREIKVIYVRPGESLDEVEARIRIINELGQQSDVVL